MKVWELKKLLGLLFFLLLLSACGGGGGGGGGGGSYSPEDPGDFIAGQLLVRISKDADSRRFAADYTCRIKKDFYIGENHYLLLEFPDQDTEKRALELQEDEQVIFSEPEYLYQPLLIPDDPYYASSQYAPQLMGAEIAWEITSGNAGNLIAVVDTGIDGGHPDFAGRIIEGYDFVGDRAYHPEDNYDHSGHGTHVAGIIGALGNNALGVAGLNWNCRLLPVRVLGISGGTLSNIAQGIIYATDQGAKVINLSLGGKNYSRTFCNAVNYALEHNVTVVAAMGNDGRPAITYPPAYQGVIAVGSTNAQDQLSYFSNQGPHISLTAPGSEILSTALEAGYETRSGTSMSTPQVSGAAALLLSAHPGLTPAEIKSQLEQTADDLGETGFDESFGWGRLNLARAVGSLTPNQYGNALITVSLEGESQEGAEVVVFNSQGQTLASTLTNASGIAKFFLLPQGDYTARAALRDQRSSRAFSITPGSLAEFNLEFTASGKTWTIMIYLDGDNDLEDDGIDDVNEMEKVGSSQDFDLLVQFDRISGYDSSNGNWTNTRRYYITQDSDTVNISSTLLQELGEKNMADPNTLTDFVVWGMENYPARHYLLILWNHGGGFRSLLPRASVSLRDICWDDSSGGDALTMPELKTALADAYNQNGQKIDILAMDACTMAMLEIAYQIKDYADLMVASEETEPSPGYPYNRWLEELAANPEYTPAELARCIVENFIDHSFGSYLTSSVLNLEKIIPVRDKVSNLADKLQEINQQELGTLAKDCQYFSDSDYLDLRHLAKLLLSSEILSNPLQLQAAKELDDILALGSDNFILYEKHRGSGVSNSYGVSIYFASPAWNSSYDSTKYNPLDFAHDSRWDEFLRYHQANY